MRDPIRNWLKLVTLRAQATIRVGRVQIMVLKLLWTPSCSRSSAGNQKKDLLYDSSSARLFSSLPLHQQRWFNILDRQWQLCRCRPKLIRYHCTECNPSWLWFARRPAPGGVVLASVGGVNWSPKSRWSYHLYTNIQILLLFSLC